MKEITREQDLSTLVKRYNRGRPKKIKGSWGGARKGAGAPGVPKAGRGFGRKRDYEGGEIKTYSFTITVKNNFRLDAEALRLGISRSAVINRFLESLPESIEDKTQAMQEAYLRKKEIKKL